MVKLKQLRIDFVTGSGRSKSKFLQRISKGHHWLKSYNNFAMWVDLPIGEVALKRVCACSVRSRLVLKLRTEPKSRSLVANLRR